MAGDLVAAVLATWHTAYGDRALVPTVTTAFIPANDEREAHYLAALLNSTPVRAYVKSYSSPGRGFGAPAIVQQIQIAKYDPANPLHVRLTEIGQAAALAASKEDPTTSDALAEMIKLLDRAVAELYGITDKELRGVLKAEVTPGPLRLN